MIRAPGRGSQVRVQTATVVLVNAENQQAIQYTQNETALSTKMTQTAIATASGVLLNADQTVYSSIKSAMGFTNAQLTEYIWVKQLRTTDLSDATFTLGFTNANVATHA